MPWAKIFENLFSNTTKGIFVLLDPDKIPREGVEGLVENITGRSSVRAVLIGTSLLFSTDMEVFSKRVKESSKVPVLLFPGSAMQLTPHVDAVLFLFLLSGRNSEYLIGEQVKMAPLIRKLELETIPTAYILIESDYTTAVEFVTNTKPIPRFKPEIAAAHAMAAEMLGMKVVYLEAGSGASNPVPSQIIREVRKSVDIPIVVGGGLRTREQVENAFQDGADYAVIGTAVEEGNLWKEIL